MEREKKTNVRVVTEVTRICGRELEGFVELVKRRQFKFYGYVVRGGGIARTVMEGGMERRRGGARPPENWISNLKGWIGKTGIEVKEMAKNR